jgi:hypothetical protein
MNGAGCAQIRRPGQPRSRGFGSIAPRLQPGAVTADPLISMASERVLILTFSVVAANHDSECRQERIIAFSLPQMSQINIDRLPVGVQTRFLTETWFVSRACLTQTQQPEPNAARPVIVDAV